MVFRSASSRRMHFRRDTRDLYSATSLYINHTPLLHLIVVFTCVFRHQNILRQIVWRNRETKTKVGLVVQRVTLVKYNFGE